MTEPSTFSEPLKDKPLPIWVIFIIYLVVFVTKLIDIIWKISVFVRRVMKKYGFFIGGVIGYLLTLIVTVILRWHFPGLDISLTGSVPFQILLVFILSVGVFGGMWLGAKISSKITSSERR